MFICEDQDHASVLLHLAVSLHDTAASIFMPGSSGSGGSPVRLRTGINSGGAVCGVVGQRRRKWSAWGHTVNLAQRMESTGAPGMIQMTAAVARQVLGAGLPAGYSIVSRGPVYVKGTGSMETFVLAHSTGADGCMGRPGSAGGVFTQSGSFGNGGEAGRAGHAGYASSSWEPWQVVGHHNGVGSNAISR